MPNSKEILEFGVILSDKVVNVDFPIAICEKANVESNKKLDVIIFFFILIEFFSPQPSPKEREQ